MPGQSGPLGLPGRHLFCMTEWSKVAHLRCAGYAIAGSNPAAETDTHGRAVKGVGFKPQLFNQREFESHCVYNLFAVRLHQPTQHTQHTYDEFKLFVLASIASTTASLYKPNTKFGFQSYSTCTSPKLQHVAAFNSSGKSAIRQVGELASWQVKSTNLEKTWIGSQQLLSVCPLWAA